MPDPVITTPESAPSAPAEHSRQQLEALLEVSEAISQQRDLPALFHDLAERLHSVVDFDFLALTLHDPVRNVMRLHILETRIPHEKPIGSEMTATTRTCKAKRLASCPRPQPVRSSAA